MDKLSLAILIACVGLFKKFCYAFIAYRNLFKNVPYKCIVFVLCKLPYLARLS